MRVEEYEEWAIPGCDYLFRCAMPDSRLLVGKGGAEETKPYSRVDLSTLYLHMVGAN